MFKNSPFYLFIVHLSFIHRSFIAFHFHSFTHSFFLSFSPCQIEFAANANGCKLADDANADSLAALFAVNSDELKKALTHRVVAARGEVFVTELVSV